MIVNYLSIFLILVNFLFSQCDQCQDVWMDSYWGEQCCDVAWNQWGFDCAYMESQYGWDCTGCECSYDNNTICGDGSCNSDENFENCEVDCTENGCNTSNQVDDCSDEDCCSSSWIGDGYADCEDPNNFGCDLSCYNNDGGDCPGSPGDMNGDNILNVLDVVLMINIVLNNEYDLIADINEDDVVNILDVVILVNILIG